MAVLPFVSQIVIMFVLGACIGSFLNVCIERWPKGESIVYPRSYCVHCHQPIPWYLNIPILGWLFLRGKSACCQKRIPLRYFLLEVGFSFVTIFVYLHFRSLFLPFLVLFCLLWVAFFTDIDTMTIPDEVTLLGISLGIVLSYFYPELQKQSESFQGLIYSVQSTFLGMGGLFAFLSFAEFFLKKEAMGLGDVKLMGCIGAFCGWQTCLQALFLAAILGCFCLLFYYSFSTFLLKKEIQLKNKQIPFGPFLSIATVICVSYPVKIWIF